jgi:hypothetical protein
MKFISFWMMVEGEQLLMEIDEDRGNFAIASRYSCALQRSDFKRFRLWKCNELIILHVSGRAQIITPCFFAISAKRHWQRINWPKGQTFAKGKCAALKAGGSNRRNCHPQERFLH